MKYICHNKQLKNLHKFMLMNISDEVYAYLILQFAVVFRASSMCKKFHIDSIYLQKNYYMVELVNNTLRIKEFSFFPNFVVKLKAFKLTYD